MYVTVSVALVALHVLTLNVGMVATLPLTVRTTIIARPGRLDVADVLGIRPLAPVVLVPAQVKSILRHQNHWDFALAASASSARVKTYDFRTGSVEMQPGSITGDHN